MMVRLSNLLRVRLAAEVVFASLFFLAGCQAFVTVDEVATIGADLTMYAAEGDAILAAATAEHSMARETVEAASTRVAELSAANAVLGATLRANYTGTPEVRAVVVNADDMGSSLEAGMMDDGEGGSAGQLEMRVTNLATASGVDANSGCSNGSVREFGTDAGQIYVTAQVTDLRPGTTFGVIWQRDGVNLSDYEFQSEMSKTFWCIWFFVTPEDFGFLPGAYQATVYVDGLELGSTDFFILAN